MKINKKFTEMRPSKTHYKIKNKYYKKDGNKMSQNYGN